MHLRHADPEGRIVLDFPRPDILKRELSNMGRVYAVVVVLILVALAFNLISDKAPTPTVETPADMIGSPSDSE